MRLCTLLAVLCLAASAQQSTNYTTDLNGRPVDQGSVTITKSGNTVTRTESLQSISGREVPLESVEERTLRDDTTGRVVERIIRRYDANGNPGPDEKHQVEERKNADGSVSSVTAVYRADLNGGFQLSERVIEDASKSGNTTTASITIERPSLSGSLDIAEKRSRRQVEETGKSSSDVVTYRRGISGSFVEALRVVTNVAEQNGRRTESTAQYEPADNGALKLASQSVARVAKNSDGTESREVDIYRNVPGRAEPSAAPPLQERQIIVQRKQGDRLVETVAVQRPSISDPGRLGAPQKIGERVCQGANCK